MDPPKRLEIDSSTSAVSDIKQRQFSACLAAAVYDSCCRGDLLSHVGGCVSVSLCLCIPLSPCLHVALWVSLFLCVPLLCLCLLVSPGLCVSLSWSPRAPCPFVTLSLSLVVSFSLFLSLSAVSISLLSLLLSLRSLPLCVWLSFSLTFTRKISTFPEQIAQARAKSTRSMTQLCLALTGTAGLQSGYSNEQVCTRFFLG